MRELEGVNREKCSAQFKCLNEKRIYEKRIESFNIRMRNEQELMKRTVQSEIKELGDYAKELLSETMARINEIEVCFAII